MIECVPRVGKGTEWLRLLEGLCKELGILKSGFEVEGDKAYEAWMVNGEGGLQAPVGYDAYGFRYRDIGGIKVHKAMEENVERKDYLICLKELMATCKPKECSWGSNKKKIPRPLYGPGVSI